MTLLSCSLLLSCLLDISTWISQENFKFASNTETLPSLILVSLFLSFFSEIYHPLHLFVQARILGPFSLTHLSSNPSLVSSALYILLLIPALIPAMAILDPFLSYQSSFSTHLHDSHIASPSGHTSCCSHSGLPETSSFYSPFSGNVPSTI